MARHIRAADVDAVLEHSGYGQSEFVDGDWEPGYRVVQSGRRQANVFHDGPGEQDGQEAYRLALQAAGFHVVPDRQLGGGRRRLHVTKP